MKVFRLPVFVLVALLAVCSLAAAQDVHTDYDHHANFERYHTYSWTRVQSDNPLWKQRIQDDIDKQLQAKGWQRVDSGGDVALSAVGAVRNDREYRTFYDGMGGWGWRGWGPGETTTTVENQKVGNLVVDMYDASNKQLIWRAVASNTLSDKPEKNEDKLQKTTEKMFKNFPPKDNK
jgi:hypothetical protein